MDTVDFVTGDNHQLNLHHVRRPAGGEGSPCCLVCGLSMRANSFYAHPGVHSPST